MSKTAEARLCGYKVSERAVRRVETPTATESWNPIGHGRLLDMVLETAAGLGFKFDGKGEYALANEGMRMYATFVLESDKRDYAVAMGVRNAMDKTMPAGIILGARVFVCGNGMFSSDFGCTGKHCINVEDIFPIRISEALKKFIAGREKQDTLIERMKKHFITIPQAGDFIIRSAQEKIIPAQEITRIYKECVSPRFDEFKGPDTGMQSVWGLYNAITTVMNHDHRDVEPGREQNMLLNVHNSVLAEFQLN